MLPQDLEKIYVRNTAGKMVPYASFAANRWSSNSPGWNASTASRHEHHGRSCAGQEFSEAMKAMEEIVGKLPAGMGYDWTGLSYQERMATSQGPLLYAFSVLVIFLCVAALYESWTIPFVNLLMLPWGAGRAGGHFHARPAQRRLLPDRVLTTLGLSTKNAILIIQFIKEQRRQGEGLIEATLAAVKIRFRPVIMTSLAFFFGTLPLAIASGAGAGR